MTRKQGEVLERHWKSGRGYALRFRAYGERRYITLGSEREGWDWDRAEEELANTLADVRRGIWVPPVKSKRSQLAGRGPRELEEVPIFGPFASQIVRARKGQVAENTTKNEEWALAHLLPFFAEWPINEIDAEAVDDYRLFKVRESEERGRAIERGRPKRNERGQILKSLEASTINKTINVLAWLLGIALEYKHVTENAAAGKRRRLREEQRPPAHLDTAGQIEVLLEAGAELDRDPKFHCTEREAILATLILAGLRAHELCNLLWRDVDLANARIFVGRSKTQAGLREITILPLLRDVLATHKASAYRSGPDDLVFPNTDGGTRNKDTLRKGVLLAAFRRADEQLIERGTVPLPRRISAHKLRHTFASILIAFGEDPNAVMTQLGHTDPTFTLRVYTHLMSRAPEERARLKALVRGERVIARPAPPPLLDYSTYELPIMHALAERGGRAPRREIVVAVGQAMVGQHASLDLERLPSGEPRWKTRVGKARARLIECGWLAGNSPRGEMELTKLGRAKVRREGALAGRVSSLPDTDEAELATAS